MLNLHSMLNWRAQKKTNHKFEISNWFRMAKERNVILQIEFLSPLRLSDVIVTSACHKSLTINNALSIFRIRKCDHLIPLIGLFIFYLTGQQCFSLKKGQPTACSDMRCGRNSLHLCVSVIVLDIIYADLRLGKKKFQKCIIALFVSFLHSCFDNTVCSPQVFIIKATNQPK